MSNVAVADAGISCVLRFNREDVANAYYAYACCAFKQSKTINRRLDDDKCRRTREDITGRIYGACYDSPWEAIDSLEESARPHFFALVAKLDGQTVADELKTNYDRIRDPAGVRVVVTNSGDDPFQVMFYVHDIIADAWADANGSLDGGTWYCPDKDTSFVYDMGMWHPKLFDELRTQGYSIDESQWSDPEEEDFAIAEHLYECAECEGQDFGAARTHWEKLLAEFPVKVLDTPHGVKGAVTCGTCYRSWDDTIVTDWTPAPSARCPFEYFHAKRKGEEA